MALASLKLLKAHCRADDFSNDDQLLLHYLRSAEAHVLNALETTEAELRVRLGGSIPADIVQAVLMLAEHMYDHRGAVDSANLAAIPYSVSAMLKPYYRFK